jgi:phosphatidylglycerophosphate synthase
VLDARLRATKDRLLAPLVGAIAPGVSPAALSLLSLAAGVGAALAAAGSVVWAAITLFLLGRLADGLDGPVARRRGRTSDLGGFTDLLGDVVVYAAVPLGVAAGADDANTWAAAAVLLATLYVNAVSWLFLAAVIARRSKEAPDHRGTTTTIPMPAGLIEGTETIVLYTIILAFPAMAATWLWIMAVLVTITILQRIHTAHAWLSN